MAIRNGIKGIIIKENKVLLNKCRNSEFEGCYGLSKEEFYYDLPGGGQNQYETMDEALTREVMEETGYRVKAENMVGLYEEISINKDIRENYPDYAHKLYLIFKAELLSEEQGEVTEKDFQMVSSVWVDLDEVKNITLCPIDVRNSFDKLLDAKSPVFLGSHRVN